MTMTITFNKLVRSQRIGWLEMGEISSHISLMGSYGPMATIVFMFFYGILFLLYCSTLRYVMEGHISWNTFIWSFVSGLLIR